MPRIGAYDNRLTILLSDGLWLRSSRDDLVDVKLRRDDVASWLRESNPGASVLLDAARVVNQITGDIFRDTDITHVGRFQIMRCPFDGELEKLWGYKPGTLLFTGADA